MKFVFFSFFFIHSFIHFFKGSSQSDYSLNIFSSRSPISFLRASPYFFFHKKIFIQKYKSCSLRSVKFMCRSRQCTYPDIFRKDNFLSHSLNCICMKKNTRSFKYFSYFFYGLFYSSFIIYIHYRNYNGIFSHRIFQLLNINNTVFINIYISYFIPFPFQLLTCFQHGRMLYFGSYNMLSFVFISI